MDKILREFKDESKTLIRELLDILETVENDLSDYRRLDQFGQIVDRIMGAAKSLEAGMADPGIVAEMGQCAELCKRIAYKGSQISDGDFLQVIIAFLLDATEALGEMLEGIDDLSQKGLADKFSGTFFDRLQWISKQFDKNLRGTLKLAPISPGEKSASESNDDSNSFSSSDPTELIKDLLSQLDDDDPDESS